ncbi:MAG TPA: cytochrome c, partial [Pyrinomonadaceae bacterium]|nr:cytochrome c [Pyrinomonadaceae bacterium]
MTLRKLTLLLAATLLLVVGCSKTDRSSTGKAKPGGQSGVLANPSQSHDESAAARVIYAKECISCHARDGTGGPVKLEDGTTLKVPSLREGHALKHDDAEFVKQITDGGDGMPKF